MGLSIKVFNKNIFFLLIPLLFSENMSSTNIIDLTYLPTLICILVLLFITTLNFRKSVTGRETQDNDESQE